MAHFKHSLVLLVVVNIATLVSLLVQLHGLILICKILEAKRNNAILAILLWKRSYFHRKMKQPQAAEATEKWGALPQRGTMVIFKIIV